MFQLAYYDTNIKTQSYFLCVLTSIFPFVLFIYIFPLVRLFKFWFYKFLSSLKGHICCSNNCWAVIVKLKANNNKKRPYFKIVDICWTTCSDTKEVGLEKINETTNDEWRDWQLIILF